MASGSNDIDSSEAFLLEVESFGARLELQENTLDTIIELIKDQAKTNSYLEDRVRALLLINSVIFASVGNQIDREVVRSTIVGSLDESDADAGVIEIVEELMRDHAAGRAPILQPRRPIPKFSVVPGGKTDVKSSRS